MKSAKKGKAWFNEKEVSTSTRPYRLTFWCLRHFPRWLVNFITYCVALYFFIFVKRARRETMRYQKNLKAFSKTFTKIRPLRQVATFAVTIVEKIDCWTNPLSFDKVHFSDDGVYQLIDQLNSGKGAFIIVSHLGDAEVLRSMANKNQMGIKQKIPITVLSDRDVSSNFSKAMNQMNNTFTLNTINVNDISPATIELLQTTISEGGMVVCAGDRMSKSKKERYLTQNFLGKPAPFSYGVYLLADLIAAPVYFVWGFRKGNLILRRESEMRVIKAVSHVGGGRKNRDERLNALCAEFAGHLERFAQEYPYQWYNFFDFWMFPNSEANGEKNENQL